MQVTTDMQLDSQGGVNRNIVDLVEAVQAKGRNQLIGMQVQAGIDDDDDW